MPSEPLSFDRKDFFKERKPSSSDPAGVVPARWRDPPTTPYSYPNNHGFFSYRWGGPGGSSDFRRPFSGHGKQVGGGWHVTMVESASLEENFCRNDNSSENNHSNGLARTPSGQTDQKGGNSWENTVSPNGSSHPRPDFVNSWDQLLSKDQDGKNNGGGVGPTAGQRLEIENSLGSSIDWKPLKWIRSESLSSRGSGLSHSSSYKGIGVDSQDIKIDSPAGNSTPVQSPSGDAVLCLTPRTPADEVSSRKKPRLGWGEGLAKYEKKVGPDDIVDKEVHARNRMIDGVSSSELLLTSPANMPDKSPSLSGYSECASPATPYSFACSSSPGVEEKAAAAAVENDICDPSVPSCHLSHNHTEGSTFNLENLELTEGFNLSSSLNELLQSDGTSAPSSGFVRCNAMDKLQVWKADISRTLEITEAEIDSLENELKMLISDVGGLCALAADSCSLPTECNDKNTEEKPEPLPLRVISSGGTSIENTDGFVEEHTGVEDLDTQSPGAATSKLVEQRDSICILDVRSESTVAKCSQDNVSNDILTACGDGRQVPALSTVPIDGEVHFSKDKLYELILASNKVLANEASGAISNLLPSSQCCSNILRATNDVLIKDKIAMRKRFLKFKERVLTLKLRAFDYLWKEDLRLLSVRSGAKSQKKFELSSRMGYTDYQKHRSSIRSRFSSPVGNLSLVPTTEIIDYANKLLSDSQARIYRNILKMPSLILDKRERISSRFISDNGLVENPCDVEKEKSLVNPWMSEEKEIFLDKFSLFGKDFRKIASFLEHKTVADCVEFYYKNHKSDRFQKAKKNSEFAKQGKSHSTSTYLVTSGKRWIHQELNAAASSLDMLGAASAMAANVDGGGKEKQRKCTSKYYVGTSRDHKLPRSDGGILGNPNSLPMYCNERESAAVDVLAGICGSISSEAMSSCITSLVDSGNVHRQDRMCQKLGGYSKRWLSTPEASQNDVDEETCSDDSCGEEMESSDWTDEEKWSFIKAVRIYGKDFAKVSRCMRTRSSRQCRVFFSKARKCLGLDVIHHEPGSEGNQGGGGDQDHDHEDACLVDSGSVISHEKSLLEGKTDVEYLHSSDFREEHDAESDQNVVNGCEAEIKPEVELVGESSSNGNLEGAADSEATEAVTGCAGERNDDSPSASGARVEANTVAEVSPMICREGIMTSEHQLPSDTRFSGNDSRVKGVVEDLNSASPYSLGLSIDNGSNMKSNASEKGFAIFEEPGDGFQMPDLFSGNVTNRKTLSQDDDVSMSSRLSFRKSSDRLSQRSSSTDGYYLHLPKRSLLDCVESSQILRGYPVTSSTNEGMNGTLSCNEPKSNLKFDQMDPCLPVDGSIQKFTPDVMSDASGSQEQRQSASSDVEMPCRSGDVKLFGQILSNRLQLPQESDRSASHHRLEGKPNGGSSFNLKFDDHKSDRRSASLDRDRGKNNYSFHADNNLQLRRSYGFWDGNRIQTGFTSLPDSALLMAKYPAAFMDRHQHQHQHQQLHSSFKSGGEQHKLSIVSGFHSRKLSNSRGVDYHMYGSSVDSKLLPEMPRQKVSSSVQVEQHQGMDVVGEASCNVSDPVAALRMHYAKTQQYREGGESWG